MFEYDLTVEERQQLSWEILPKEQEPDTTLRKMTGSTWLEVMEK